MQKVKCELHSESCSAFQDVFVNIINILVVGAGDAFFRVGTADEGENAGNFP